MKRGNKSKLTKLQMEITPENPTAIFDETFSKLSMFFKNEKKN